MSLLKYLHVALYFILIPLYTIVGASILFLLFPFFRRRMYIDYLMRIWARLLLITCGVRVTYEGREHIDEDKPCIYVANHQSLFDIPACFMALPGRLRWLAKKELFRIPIFGWGMWVIGHVSIDRERSEKAVGSVDHAVERLKKEDISPVVFPEGTRSPDGRIHRFKKGAFVMAIKAERDIVPVTIIGSRKIAPKKSFFISSGTIHVCIHEPISTKGLDMAARSNLAKDTNEIISSRFNAGTK